MDIRKVPTDKLLMAKYNPRADLKPEDEEYKALERSIESFGYIDPIIWNERTGNVIGGHQRLKILIAHGKKEIEVSCVNASEEEEKLINLALNKISGKWDEEKLEEILKDLQESSSDILLSGFDQEELDAMLINFEDEIIENFFVSNGNVDDGTINVEKAADSIKERSQQENDAIKSAPSIQEGQNEDKRIQCPNCGEWIKLKESL